jgi:ubiquitin-like-conjugating enzyme ATG10
MRLPTLKVTVEYHIVLSPSYQVPVLYFNIKDPSYRSPPTMDTLYRHLIPPHFKAQAENVGVIGGITVTVRLRGNI